MRKIIFIILLVSFIVMFTTQGLADWNNWNKELPPAGNENWELMLKDKKLVSIRVKEPEDSIVFSIAPLFFYFDAKSKDRMTVVFYLPGDISIKKLSVEKIITNSILALAAFPQDPQEEKKVVIGAYKMENQVFKYYEDWKIDFKNDELLVPKGVNFRGEFQEFIICQVERLGLVEELFSHTSKEDFSAQFLPRLQVFENNKVYLIRPL